MVSTFWAERRYRVHERAAQKDEISAQGDGAGNIETSSNATVEQNARVVADSARVQKLIFSIESSMAAPSRSIPIWRHISDLRE